MTIMLSALCIIEDSEVTVRARSIVIWCTCRSCEVVVKSEASYRRQMKKQKYKKKMREKEGIISPTFWYKTVA